MRVGLVNGRGAEDMCSIIRFDKGGQAEGRKGEDDGAFSMSLLFIMSYFCLQLLINIIALQISAKWPWTKTVLLYLMHV